MIVAAIIETLREEADELQAENKRLRTDNDALRGQVGSLCKDLECLLARNAELVAALTRMQKNFSTNWPGLTSEDRAELHACRKQADIALAKAGGKE